MLFSRNFFILCSARRSLSAVRKCTCGELRVKDVLNNESSHVVISGWLQYQRLSGKFFTLRDGYGVTQVLVPDEASELASVIAQAPLESVIQVTGTVVKRPDGLANAKMPTGEIEIHAKKIEILNKCGVNPQPFQVSRAASVNELTRLQYRYIDLRSNEMQEAIRIRSEFLHRIRSYLITNHRFVEVETPYLFRKTPAGAREYLVPTRNPHQYFCLPQSPQQFKQVLMAGGVDRYIQVARCFRDESARADRQPEFTQLDMEVSFADEDTIRSLIEGAIVASWPSLKNLDNCSPPILPFKRLKYDEVMELFGSDKPDLRFPDWKLQKSKSGEFRMIAFDGVYRFFSGGQEGKKSLQDLELTVSQKYPSAQFHICKLCPKLGGKLKSVGTRYCPKDIVQDVENSLAKSTQAEDGIVIIVPATLKEDNLTDTRLWLGHARHFVGALCERHGWPASLDYKRSFEFLWVEEFPMFVPAATSDSATIQSKIGVECGHHPFTAPHPHDAQLFRESLHAQPIDVEKLLRVRSRQYDLVLNGREVGGGSVRIHDSSLQRRVLVDVLGHKAEDFDFFLQALASGCPPHAGIALGVERLLATLLHRSSVREVMAFPKSSEGRDVMTGAPCLVPSEDLDFYGQKRPTEKEQQKPTEHINENWLETLTKRN